MGMLPFLEFFCIVILLRQVKALALSECHINFIMSVGVFVSKIHDKFLAIHFYYITATCSTLVGGCKSGTVLSCACT